MVTQHIAKWMRRGEGPAERAEPIMPLKPRKMTFPFGTHIPRCWFGGSLFVTHAINGLNLLFPAGERYFIRSVRRYQEAAREDPALWQRVSGFMAQEVRHGIEHKRFFATLEAQGFELEAFLELYEERFYARLEGTMPPALLLSGTVALEHYTAALGEVALTSSLLEGVDEVVGDLLRWHAAEEIEHKSVAFDVLEAAGISYPTRVTGFLLGTLGLFGWWFVATRMLLRQEAALQARERAEGVAPPAEAATPKLAEALDVTRGLFEHGVAQAVVGGVLDYLRPDFHPDQRDNYAIAAAYLAAMDDPHDAPDVDHAA